MYLTKLLVSSAIILSAEVVNAWSPTNGYAPATVECDKNITLVRDANGLSSAESDWVSKRDVVTKEALQSFLNRATNDFKDNSLLNKLFDSDSDVPRVGITCSGGGYRAMLSGAGMLSAFDNRTEGANENGLGGLLQSATYIASLSGGTWLTGTLVYNNWTSVQDIINQMGDKDGSIWDTYQTPITPGGTNSTLTKERFANVSSAINEKADAGFEVSLADAWGLIFGYYFFPSLPEGGVGYTWSTLQDVDVFQNAEMPYLINVGKVHEEGTTGGANLSSAAIEITPYELGSWDPNIKSFTDIKYLGTKVSNGVPVSEGQCVKGFDNVNFLIATSADLLEEIEASGVSYYDAVIDQLAVEFLGNRSNNTNRDFAIYAPNPFKDTSFIDSNVSNSLVTSDNLLLVDGGMDGQTIPFTPVMKKERNLDVVFAFDNGADSAENWPNGAAVIATYEHQFLSEGIYDAFPHVPDIDTFEGLGLNKRPTFFGCDSSNLTDLAYIPPLVVYIPNTMHSFASNVSTFQLSFDKIERENMIRNGFEVATRNNMTDDSNFLGCVGCAVMRRKQEKLGLDLPKECEQCFQSYCWDGTLVGANSTNTTTGQYNNATKSITKSSSQSQTGSSVTLSTTINSSNSHTSNSSSTHSSSHKNGAEAVNIGSVSMLFAIPFALFNLL